MKRVSYYGLTAIGLMAILFIGCSKGSSSSSSSNPPQNFSLSSWSLNGKNSQALIYDIPKNISLQLNFSNAIDRNSVPGIITLKDNSGTATTINVSYTHSDSNLLITTASALHNLTKYKISINANLKSKDGGNLNLPTDISFITSIDSSDKFPVISDSALLDLVQKQTFSYFWDFGHPVSG